MDKADKIANEGRKSISSYCIEECKSYCCRKGYLVMNKKELDTVAKGRKEEYKEEIKKIGNNKFSLSLEKGCPSLSEDFKCKIHENKNRPKVCGDFPIFLNKDKKIVLLSPRCLAVRNNLLYPYVKRLQMEGYKIAKVDDVIEGTDIIIPDKVIDEKVVKKKFKSLS